MGPLPDKGNCFLQKNLATSSRQNKCLKSLNSKTRLWENVVLSSLREKLMVFSKTHGTLWEILMVFCEWYLMFLWKRYPTVFFERCSLGPLREKSSLPSPWEELMVSVREEFMLVCDKIPSGFLKKMICCFFLKQALCYSIGQYFAVLRRTISVLLLGKSLQSLV